MAFTIRHTGGVVCVAMPDGVADHLELPPMVERNDAPRQTAFTVTIDAARGIGTGISAHDRALTVMAAAEAGATAADLVRPGHVFPLRAREGGVLRRAGHTEATVDLCRLAGFRPVGVLSELMHDDGSMMRLPQLLQFAGTHGLRVGTIADLIRYRVRRAPFVRPAASRELASQLAAFRLHGFADELGGCEHVAFTLGATRGSTRALVRIHTECAHGPTASRESCRCAELRAQAVAAMTREGRGVLVCLRSPADGQGRHERNYAAAAQILQQLQVEELRLLTNDPQEGPALAALGPRVSECIPL